MSEFKQYRRTQKSELRPYVPGEDMTNITLSESDIEKGSPKKGDMVARNPADHNNQWLVEKDYFDTNFEPVD